MNPPEQPKRRTIISDADARAAVLETCRRGGCNCDPWITFNGPITLGAIQRARVAHDDWCTINAPIHNRPASPQAPVP